MDRPAQTRTIHPFGEVTRRRLASALDRVEADGPIIGAARCGPVRPEPAVLAEGRDRCRQEQDTDSESPERPANPLGVARGADRSSHTAKDAASVGRQNR